MTRGDCRTLLQEPHSNKFGRFVKKSFGFSDSKYTSMKPKTQTPNNPEQLIQDNASTSKSNNESPMLAKDHPQEEEQFDFHSNRKQSVLTKVKEKAKKWKQNLVKKKPGHDDDDNHPPSWGVALEDSENDDVDNLGAPMYKSEIASNGQTDHSENRMQADDPSTSRSPVLEEDVKNPRPIRNSTSVYRVGEFSSSNNTKENNLTSKETPLSSLKLVEDEGCKTPNPSPQAGTSMESEETGEPSQMKKLVDAVIEKLTPDYATISDASQLTRISSAQRLMSLAKPINVTPSDENDTDLVEDLGVAYGVYEEKGVGKGASIKEYINDKLEPGEDERILSRVISEAMTPSYLPGDKGVMEKVREVVTSLLLAEQEQEEREEAERQKQRQEEEEEEQQQQQQQQQRDAQSTRQPSSSSSPQIPVSTNAYEGEEETQGRILQAN